MNPIRAGLNFMAIVAVKYFKSIKLICLVVLFAAYVGFISFVYADESLSFTWDANQPRDNVTAYNIYWITSPVTYDESDIEEVLEGLLNGEIDYDIVSINVENNPNLEMYSPGKYRYTITVDESEGDKFYYFVCTAFDGEFESGFSDTAMWENTSQIIDPPKNGGGGGGGGGGCFCSTLGKLFYR